MATRSYPYKDTRDTAPAIGAAAVTASDSADLTDTPTRALWVGTAGDVKCDMQSGETVTFKNVSGLLPVAVKRVYSTGSTASSIIALY